MVTDTFPCAAVVAIKGNFLLGLNFLIVSLYPIRVGATLMSSFLVNTALILAMSCAVIQFCASAFSAYANSSMIFGIFGSQVGAADHLMRCLACARRRKGDCMPPSEASNASDCACPSSAPYVRTQWVGLTDQRLAQGMPLPFVHRKLQA